MSNFYPSSSAQVDVLSAPYVQDQKFTSYSESPIIHGNMMMYIHGAPSGGPFFEIPPGNSLSTHNSIDIPSMAGRNEMMFIPPTTGYHIPAQTINGQSIEGEQNLNGLSLSLSTQLSTAIPPAPFEQFSNAGISPVGKVDEACQNSMRFGNPNNLQELVHHKAVGYNVNQYEQGGNARVIIKSRFLKAVQQLLDEVVNVQDALKQKESAKERSMKRVEDGNTESKEKSASASDVNESGSGPSEELSATQRQDLQNKLDKLLAMLDEVDRRYKQYYHQMQILVSSFETIAGCGAAKPYTTLALKTISRHFRSLRDAISIQIQATRKSLGEQDSGQGVIPRLRYVDQHLRQQRALQQFGMMRHAWRPQRGLPENAVTILRAWLFEHFLHPYPKDSEKIMLARQTGLTRSQVGNWFINARVRLWKPMVEEMYKEEFGEADLNLKSSPENAPNNTAGEMSRTTQDWREELQEMNHSTGRAHFMVSSHGDDDDKHRRLTKLHDNPHNMNSHGFYPQYQNGLVVDNQVSLALGLQRIDGTTSRPGASAENAVGPETGEYSYFGQVNQQSKFGNSHLLDDFVV